MKEFFSRFFQKISGKEEERKIEILSAVVERNKIQNSGASIDDVVSFAVSQKLEHYLYL